MFTEIGASLPTRACLCVWAAPMCFWMVKFVGGSSEKQMFRFKQHKFNFIIFIIKIVWISFQMFFFFFRFISNHLGRENKIFTITNRMKKKKRKRKEKEKEKRKRSLVCWFVRCVNIFTIVHEARLLLPMPLKTHTAHSAQHNKYEIIFVVVRLRQRFAI